MKIRWWRNEFKVGLVVLVAIVLLSIMLIKAYDWRFTPGGREIKIRFDYVGGLLKSAPVHMYGMEIGKVTGIALLEDGVEVTARLYEDISIRSGYQVLIDILGLVGEKYIEIINGPVAGSPLARDALLEGTNPISVGYVLLKVDEITNKTLTTMDFVQSFINTNEREISNSVIELKKLIVEARSTLKETLDNVNILLTKINGLTERVAGEVTQTTANVRNFTEELNKDRAEISSTIQEITGNLTQLVTRSTPAIEQSLSNLQEVSEEAPVYMAEIKQHIDELSKSTSQFMAKLNDVTAASDGKLQKGLDDFGKSAAVLSETVDKIDRLIAGIENGRGTLGKLITDDGTHEQLDETMVAGKRAAEDIGSVARRLDGKLKLLDTLSTRKGYELSYNDLSHSLQSQFTLSSTRPSPYFYLAGLSIRAGDLSYNLQVGRRFGDLTARAGSIRSKAGIGFDYWPFSRRIGVSLEGVDVTKREPQLDVNFAVRLIGGWYFIFGAEDIVGTDTGLIFGFKTEIDQIDP